MAIKLKLLGDVNRFVRNEPNYSLAPKFVASIKASELTLYLRYKKSGKKHPFKLDIDSLISVDPDIQRGLNPENGNLRQEEKKINEIKDSLLGVSSENPRVFLGTLVWNVRPPAQLSVITINREGKPPEYELEIDAAKIWLTDSAHRHLGICEAVKQASIEPGKFPRFNKEYEFTVDIYNLDVAGEKALFKELNSKQKKITAAKAQQVDATSKIGMLKSRIIELDQLGSNQKMLYQNIEVNSNQNDRHTLMTMSLFSSSIKEMFGAKLVNESAVDEDLREILADYYLRFLYKLRESIKVKCSIRGKDIEVHPFVNLYIEKILPEEVETESLDLEDEVAERRLKTVRDEVNAFNKQVREQEKIHSNPVIKALSRIGGYVRYMGNWEKVLENIQTRMIVPAGGRFFQAANEELLLPRKSGVTIATRNEDGKSINIQVVSQVISELEDLFRDRLDLNFRPALYIEKGDEVEHVLTDKPSYTLQVSRDKNTYADLRLDFDVGSTFQPEKSSIRLRVTTEFPAGVSPWKEAERKGAERLSVVKMTPVLGYEHASYGSAGVKRFAANFEIDLPPFKGEYSGNFVLRLAAELPDFDGQAIEAQFVLSCQID